MCLPYDWDIKPAGANKMVRPYGSEKLLYLIECIEKAMSNKAKKNMLPILPGDFPVTYADIDKARKLISFEPTTNIDVRVKRFLE